MHFYKVGDYVLPSVTTLVKFISLDDSLLRWANYMGFKRKDISEERDQSTYFGNLVHSNLRSMVDGNAPDPMKAADKEYGERLYNSLLNFDELMSKYQYETMFTERTFKSTKLGYAGTIDWVATINKDYVVLSDFKTSKQVNRSMYLQLGGYYGLLEEAGIKIDYAQIILVNDTKASIKKLDKAKLRQYYKAFMDIVGFYQDYTSIVGPLYKPEDLIEDTLY